MDFLDDGRIKIDLDDGNELITLRRPKYGAYKRFRLAVVDMSTETVERIKKANELEDDDAKLAAVHETEEHAADLLETVWRDIVTTLGDRQLPESVDDWPVELIVGQGVMQRVMEHWRTRPLDRGAMGNPIPST